MSIYKKTIIVIICTSLVLLGLVYWVSDSIYRRGFEKLERQQTERNIIRVNEALSAKLDALDTFCADWSLWDDAHDFAREYNQDFIDRNLQEEIFISGKVNLICILDSAGDMVYGQLFDLVTSEKTLLSNDFSYTLHAHGIPDPVDQDSIIKGIILINDQPMIVSSHPALTGVGTGPSTGSIIMGRFLDPAFISSLSITTHNSIELLPVANNFNPASYHNVDQMNNSLPVFVQALNKNTITGYTYCEDLNGNPVFIFKVTISRDIYLQGMNALSFLQYSLMFFGVVFCVVFIFLIRKLVLSRLTALSKSVNKIASSGDVSHRIPLSGNDELAGLALNINNMLTSLENAVKKQRSQQELISYITDNTPDAILVIDKAENVVLVNKAFCDIFDLDTVNISGQNIQAVPTLAGLVPKIEEFLGSRSMSTRSGFQYGPDGRKKTFVVGYTRMNEDSLSFMVLTDVSEEKQRHEVLFLTDRLVSVGQMASGVAHELNNPLTSIIGLSSLLTRQEMPEDFKDDLTSINTEARRCAAIVKNLLTFARKHPSARGPVDVRTIIEDVLKLRSYEHKANNIAVETAFPHHLPAVPADYFQMQQVFLNIILNAETAMIDAHSGGILKISVESINSHIMISFSDNGPGISEENMHSLFNPFFTTKDVGKGTGLGLSICYGIVTAHSGKIRAESEFGKGATFVVELPVTKD
jgi:PAS domain S-box-containing protein